MPSSIDPLIARIIHDAEGPDTTLTYSSNYQVHSSSGREYFTKVGRREDAAQYIGEAESLKALSAAAAGLAPRLLGCIVKSEEYGKEEGRPVFVSEYKSMRSLSETSGKKLAQRLATELHAYKSPNGRFGFDVPTFCGATRQENGWYNSWEECYEALIAGLLDRLPSRYGELRRKGEEVRAKVIPALLGSLDIQPVLIHGDLWGGNTGTDSTTGEPVIFDPSSYYGHNEADLAISRMFGGFPQSFWSIYHQHMPKSEPADEYELRNDLYQLYHYLNHTVLFGGSYASSAEARMDRLLNAISQRNK